MKVVVAGAGHGGLVAAAKLAKNGCDVTVIEKRKREELGHDWEDRFDFNNLLTVVEKTELPENSWCYRGDCAFVSPSYNTEVIINYNEENRQKIMWRKPVMDMLISYAEECGVKFVYETAAEEATTKGNRVTGLKTDKGEFTADLVIDAAGVFSPVRTKLPESFNIEKTPVRGDVFYAYRAYYGKTDGDKVPDVPFEIYLCHEGEPGLSWCNTKSDIVDILIGRIDELQKDNLEKHIEGFRKKHPYMSEEILHGGNYGVIPVRRPLALMVADGYAAVGDSAFMTTPMNGMGIDLSLLAGGLLAKTLAENNFDTSIKTLWKYNREFHVLYGGITSKNEGLKNSLLQLPKAGVDFLFDNAIVQAADLAGAGGNMSVSVLMGKFVRGMKNPPYFFTVLGGIMKGSKMMKAYKNAPDSYEKTAVAKWQQKIRDCVVPVTRK